MGRGRGLCTGSAQGQRDEGPDDSARKCWADGPQTLRPARLLGPFSTSSAWRSFQRACAKLGLAGLRPYDLRHSFGTAVYAATGDLRATQKLLGHASRATTDRYTLAAVPERLQLAVGQTEKLFKGEKIMAVPRGSTKPVLVTSTKHSVRP